MENLSKAIVYQIVREKELNCILPSDVQVDHDRKCSLDQIAVFMHLHYQEDMEYYLSFLKRIPSGIHIYIFVSDRGMREKIGHL